MNLRLHKLENIPEFQEIDVLLRFQRMLGEKWNDDLPKVLLTPYSISHSVAMVHPNHTASEKSLQSMEYLHVSLMLHYGKFR